jgi:prolyl-tRNA synthetase
MAEERKITPQGEDFAQWYQDVVEAADLAEDAPVRGCMIIKPYGYAIWERLQRTLDDLIKASGAQNAYFPLLIPESFFAREADHIEGFAPECAVVTHGGGKELEEKLYIRPTSETIINDCFRRWISSWRDLPLVINQWANVVRWELRPRKFLRTLEFLWQEGHTAHATSAEAAAKVQQMLAIYQQVAETLMAIAVVPGEKSPIERFAGATRTFTIEAMMQNGWALQAGTSHELGQGFARAFDIQFQDAAGQRSYAWTTSWGVSTRLIGALVMSHGDDRGIVLPPEIAPIQAVLVPIYRKDDERANVLAAAERLRATLAGSVRLQIDDRDNLRPGAKYHEWEKKGVPLRLEIGPRDVAAGQVMVVRRVDGVKSTLALNAVVEELPRQLAALQHEMLERNRARRVARTYRVASFAEFAEALVQQPGWYRLPWCGDSDEERRIKEETKASIRCIPADSVGQPLSGPCALTGRPAVQEAIFARAY